MPGPCPLAMAMMRVPATRWNTRAELLPGLVQAVETIDAEPTRAISLEELAAVACLSPYHFQRLFKETFGQTPAAYQREVRYRLAASLLASGASVQEACLEAGFLSVGSFSRGFRTRLGVAPSLWLAKLASADKPLL